MWTQKINYLNKINARNIQKGKVIDNNLRISYDLSVLISKYNDYLNWLQKNKEIEKSIVRNDINTTITDNKVYENIVHQSKDNNEDELNDLDDWI